MGMSNAYSIIFTAALGFAFGFRLPGTVAEGLAALGLCLIYGVVFTVVFIVIGLISPNPQAAQGMSVVAFILAFLSSTYVPAASMPGWLQGFAKHQPIIPWLTPSVQRSSAPATTSAWHWAGQHSASSPSPPSPSCATAGASATRSVRQPRLQQSCLTEGHNT